MAKKRKKDEAFADDAASKQPTSDGLTEATTAATDLGPLLRLSGEIRNMIWEYVGLQAAGDTLFPVRRYQGKFGHKNRWTEAPLLRVCKQIRAEAYPFLLPQCDLKLYMSTKDFAKACKWIRYVVENAKCALPKNNTVKPFGHLAFHITKPRWEDRASWFPLAKLFFEMDIEFNDVSRVYVPLFDNWTPIGNPDSIFQVEDVCAQRVEHKLEEVKALGTKGKTMGWSEQQLKEAFNAWAKQYDKYLH